MFKWSSQTWFLTLVGIAGLIVLSVVFFSVGYLAGQTAGIETARARVANFFPSTPREAMVVSGAVLERKENALLIQADPVSANPLDPQGPVQRLVKIGDNTAMVQQSPKTSQEFDRENEAYRAALTKGEAVAPPLPYSEASLTINDFKAGDAIRARAESNIYFEKEFTAVEVSRLQQAE